MRIKEITEQRERYRGVVEPSSKRHGQEIQLIKPVRAYHATHEAAGLVLTNRQVETYDSMGTWLSSNRELVRMTFGPTVEAYWVPPGRYLLAKRKQELRDLILSCLPMIEEHVGKDAADYLSTWGWWPENREWLERLKTNAMAEIERRGKKWYGGTDQIVDYIRFYADPPFRNAYAVIDKYKKLDAAHDYYRRVAINKSYNQAFRDMLERTGIRGIIWNNRLWDSDKDRHTIFLIFHEEDLHPITDQADSLPA